MKKLSKAKRDQIILVGLGTLCLLGLIVFGLIRSQYNNNSVINDRIKTAREKLQSMEDTIEKAKAVSAQLTDLSTNLVRSESDLATGDPNQWIYNTVRNLKDHYQVDISVMSQLSTGSADLLPDFPYKQIKVTVGGTAYYHDLGKMIAGFEDEFPHAQVTNLNLEPAGNDSEKLAFRMDIVALINPNGPPS